MIFELTTDIDGNPVYEELPIPNWNGFKGAFARNEAWIIYGSQSPLLASRVETLALSDNPDVDSINQMIALMFSMNIPAQDDRNNWQTIADNYHIPIKF